MAQRLSAYRGCLLGLAVGDAMGYAVDVKNLEEIHRDYGPNGLLGYDLVNGYADVTSHTQLAAFVANGLLIGATRGQLRGQMGPFIQYVALAEREWSWIQHARKLPERPGCWISQVPELRRRHCMDTRMLDTLSKQTLGTPEEPINHFTTCGAITTAIPVGLFFHPDRMKVRELGHLGAETVALTHGDPLAFLTGAVLSFIIAGIVHDEQTSLSGHFLQAANAVAGQFGREYPDAVALQSALHHIIDLAEKGETAPNQVMEQLRCDTCEQILCGAVYAALSCGEDFDTAMITAVNHSGRSAAVAALTGAILGARLGEEALPEFYLESLEPVEALRTLAGDMAQGCPLTRSTKLFDDDWDRKYIQGELVEREGWYED